MATDPFGFFFYSCDWHLFVVFSPAALSSTRYLVSSYFSKLFFFKFLFRKRIRFQREKEFMLSQIRPIRSTIFLKNISSTEDIFTLFLIFSTADECGARENIKILDNIKDLGLINEILRCFSRAMNSRK